MYVDCFQKRNEKILRRFDDCVVFVSSKYFRAIKMIGVLHIYFFIWCCFVSNGFVWTKGSQEHLSEATFKLTTIPAFSIGWTKRLFCSWSTAHTHIYIHKCTHQRHTQRFNKASSVSVNASSAGAYTHTRCRADCVAAHKRTHSRPTERRRWRRRRKTIYMRKRITHSTIVLFLLLSYSAFLSLLILYYTRYRNSVSGVYDGPLLHRSPL